MPVVIPRPTRGLRNRNPGNLRDNPKYVWLGQTGVDARDFVIFDTDENGIRALVVDLHTDVVHHDLNTIRLLFDIYAPPSENDTVRYDDFVAEALGVAVDAPLTFDRATATTLVKAVIHMEQGQQPYGDATLAAGVEAAFVHFAQAAAGTSGR